MKVIKCPKCYNDVEINIAKCVDEYGEEHICPKCGMIFRFVDR